MKNFINKNKEELFFMLSFLIFFILGFISGYIKHIEISKKTDYKTNDNCINLENKYYCEVFEKWKKSRDLVALFFTYFII